jgi:hypothetical protein
VFTASVMTATSRQIKQDKLKLTAIHLMTKQHRGIGLLKLLAPVAVLNLKKSEYAPSFRMILCLRLSQLGKHY